MARGLTSAVQTELAKGTLRPIILVEAEFSSGTINVWNGVGDLSWNSKTWKGLGELGKISPLKETAEVRADNFVLELSGIPAALLTKALDEVRYGKPATVYWAFLTSAGAVIVSPFAAKKGIIDRAEIEEGGKTGVIRINCESAMAAFRRPNIRRLTDEHQQALFSGDLGLAFVAKLQQKEIIWGKGADVPQGGGGGGGSRAGEGGFRIEEPFEA